MQKLLLLFSLAISIFIGCEKNLYRPEAYSDSSGKVLVGISKSAIPAVITRIQGIMTSNLHDQITFEVSVTDGPITVLVENIPSGNWRLNLFAYDNQDNMLYSGSADVYIIPNYTLPLNIKLEPTMGNLMINISWSSDDLNKEVLFYKTDMLTNQTNIFLMDFDGNDIRQLTNGNNAYPVWYQNKSKILYLDTNNHNLMSRENKNNNSNDLILTHYNENMILIYYSRVLNKLLYSYYQGGLSRIGAMDLATYSVETVTKMPYDERSPVTSAFDDKIYFLTKRDNTSDIYRMQIDGSGYEPILTDDNYNFSNFSVSADGHFIVTPKYNDSSSYIIVYNILSSKVEQQIDVSQHGIPLYPSLTYDNQYIFFVFGIPNDYTTPRNIYRVCVDGSNLTQLTFFTSASASRPLTW